jgi:hypothetical protein
MNCSFLRMDREGMWCSRSNCNLCLKSLRTSVSECSGYPENKKAGRSLSFINDNTTHMTLSGTSAVVLFMFVAILISPAAAFISLGGVQVTPPEDSIPAGDVVNASAVIQIIPQGPTTFIEGYTLVLSTDLENARWNAVVMVDSTQAAVIPGDGKFVFINGYLLSYPTNRDVAVNVQIEGTVPFLADGTPFRVLQAEELNNQGRSVGDSEQVVVRNIIYAGPQPTAPLTDGAATTVVTVPVPVTTTKAGLSLFPVLGGIALVAALVMKKGF